MNIEWLSWRQQVDASGALDELPLYEFIVVWLHIYEGRSFAEIAERLELPKSTAYDVWRAARLRLQQSPALRAALLG